MSKPEPTTAEPQLQPETPNPAQEPGTPESDAEWRIRIEAELAELTLTVGALASHVRADVGTSTDNGPIDSRTPDDGQPPAEAQTPAQVPPAETGQTAPPGDVPPRDTHPWFNRVGS